VAEEPIPEAIDENLATRQDEPVRPTPKLQLIETAIGEPILDYLDRLRKDDRSWPYIARVIAQRTEIEISDEWLRVWYLEAIGQPASGAGG
jgi:hypothetical protein